MGRVSVKILASALAGALCLSFPSTAQDPDPTEDRLLLRMGETNAGHRTLLIEIGELGPYHFIVDTGASHSAIALPIAQAAGYLPELGEENTVQALDAVFTADVFPLRDVSVNGLDIGDIESVVLPSEDDASLEVVGFFATNALGSDRYRLDFADGELMLNPRAPRYRDAYYSSTRGLIFAEGRVSDRLTPVRVMIDTGSPRSFINAALFNLVPGRASTIEFHARGVGQGDPSRTRTMTIRSLRIGGVCFDDADTLLADLEIFDSLGWADEPAIILGMDLLSRTRMTVDLPSGIVELSPSTRHTRCRYGRVQLRGAVPVGMP